eukprot:6186442-Pleurochrysis_carterae.AAC.1
MKICHVSMTTTPLFSLVMRFVAQTFQLSHAPLFKLLSNSHERFSLAARKRVVSFRTRAPLPALVLSHSSAL